MLNDAQAAYFTNHGFEIGLHIDTGCKDWTPSSLESFYAEQLAEFSLSYPSIPPPSSERTHCVAWSDWATQPKVQFLHGIRLDTNYYYWPDNWVKNRPGFFTGSGMPMRFADVDGTMIDVYQATTQMTDQSGQSYPFTINSLLDKALGPEGYYGAFTVNAHTDYRESYVSDAIISSALARKVPVVSARQMLEWLDARGNSSFSSFSWNNYLLSFTLSIDPNAKGLQVMLPFYFGSRKITELKCGENPVNYSIETIKGIDYAIFLGSDCIVEAKYELDTTSPIISNITITNITSNSATINWLTNEPANSQVKFGLLPDDYTQSSELIANFTTSHSIVLSGLEPQTTYHFKVFSADANGNESISDNYSFTTKESETIPEGLISAYFFDEGSGGVALDSSGNNLHGTLINGPIWTEGIRGSALQFNGINNYVLIPSRIYTMSGGTLSLWFKKTGRGGGNNVIIGSWGGSGSQRSPTFFVPSTTLMWEFGSLTMRNTGQPIEENRWYHVVMTYDNSFNVKVYLNGVLVDSGTSANPLNFFSEVHIGHYANYGTQFFQGIIDEVLIWNRPLSGEEVYNLFNH